MDESVSQGTDAGGEKSPFVNLVVGGGKQSDDVHFGELLERLRWNAGLSRSDAAAKLGFTSEYLRLIELGDRTPALGQMRKFLAVYGARGDVEAISPQGFRRDLLVFDPLNGEEGEPIVVEFKSRIRQARRTLCRKCGAVLDSELGCGRCLDSEAAEIGLVVKLLMRADALTLRKVLKLLEGNVD